MANRYWVGGTGLNTDTAHWSTTSGGASGAAQPTQSDDIFIDSNSGFGAGGTVLNNSNQDCRNFTSTVGHAYTFAPALQVYGSATLEASMTLANTIYFRGAVSTGRTFTQNGATVYGLLSGFEGGSVTQVGDATIGAFGFTMETGSYSLQGNLTVVAGMYGDTCIFSANGYNVTADDFYFATIEGLFPSAVVNMGSGTWTATGNDTSQGQIWIIDNSGGGSQRVTINAGTSIIKLTDATSNTKTFIGGGLTYNNIWMTGAGTGAFIFQDSNTFNNFKVDTPPHTLEFIHGTTTNIVSLDAKGSAGNLITIQSDNSSSHNLTGSGTMNADYLSISNSNATPFNVWYAGNNSTDRGGNSGWVFTSKPTAISSSFLGSDY